MPTLENSTPTTTPTTVPTSPTGTAPGGLAVPTFGGAGAAGGGGVDPQSWASDYSLLGLSQTNGANLFETVIIPGGAGTGGGGGYMGIGPFGLGTPLIGGHGPNGGVTIGDLYEYIASLPPDQLKSVQADLANAGYYGKMNTATSEPNWGSLSTADSRAMLTFFKDLADNSQQQGGGMTIAQLLSQKQAANTGGPQTLSGKAPVRESGKAYNIVNLDPNQARDMVDQASLKIYGRTLDEKSRDAYAGWLNNMNVNRQQQAIAGQTAMDNANAQADAYAQSLVDPTTGQQLDYNAITATARQYLGTPYVWGGTGGASGGFDCSGLVQAVYKSLGVTLPRTSQEMWNSPTNGAVKSTTLDGIQPGDIVFFEPGSTNNGGPAGPGHVGIYIGNGMMINAPHTGANVQIDAVSSFASSGGLVGYEHFNQLSAMQETSVPVPTGNFGVPTQSPTPGSPASARIADQTSDPFNVEGTIRNTAAALAAQYGVSPDALTQIALASADVESGDNPSRVGDQGTSFGLYQLHQGGELGNMSQQQAFDPGTNAHTAISVMAQMLKDHPDWTPGQVAAAAQRPADATGYAAKVNAIVQGATPGGTELTGTNATVSVPGAAGSTITNVNGRNVVSTPDTITNSTDQSTTALQDALEARLRAGDPNQARAQDMVQVYGWMSNLLKSGIHPTNQ